MINMWNDKQGFQASKVDKINFTWQYILISLKAVPREAVPREAVPRKAAPPKTTFTLRI